MALFNDTYCQNCDRFITKEQWNKHPFSSDGHLHRKVNGYWPMYFPQRKLTRDEGCKLEKDAWEIIFTTKDCIEGYEFLKSSSKMCTKINNYVPIRPWSGDENEEEQWGYVYRDDMIAQFKEDL